MEFTHEQISEIISEITNGEQGLQGKRQICHHVPVIALAKITAPFSFFGWIFVNPAHYEERELHEIIVHESAHVRQWHSLDMLLGEILCIFFWFNPELLENYLTSIETTFKEVYSDSAFTENMISMLKAFTTPATIAFAETFNKIFTGFIFSLLLAGLLRRTRKNKFI